MNSATDDVARAVRATAPPRIDDMWAPEDESRSWAARSSGDRARSMEHWHAEYVDLWPSPSGTAGAAGRISSLLRDGARCGALASELADAAFQLGIAAQQLSAQLPDGAMLVSPCLGCNTPYDSGRCVHPNRPEPLRIDLDGTAPWHSPVRARLHRALKLLTLATALLSRTPKGGGGGGAGNERIATDADEDVLVHLLAPEPPPGVRPSDFCMREVLRVQAEATGRVDVLPVIQVVGIIDNCSALLPKAAQRSAGLLSLVVSRRPSAALSLIDPDMLSQALDRYLGMVFGLVSNSECIVEETFGIVSFLNILPLLYFLSDWKEARAVLPRHQLPAIVATTMINILHQTHRGLDDDRVDRSPDLDRFPELQSANVVVAPLIGGGDRGTMLRERPMSFAVAASLEVLGRWSHRGVPVSSGMIPTSGGDPPEPVSNGVAEYLPRLQDLIDRTPAMAACGPIAREIASGDRARMPAPERSLLREPLLRASMRCALGSCSRTEAQDGGPLKRCGGGCQGLARYCSQKHLAEHWRQHKFFCKRQEGA